MSCRPYFLLLAGTLLGGTAANARISISGSVPNIFQASDLVCAAKTIHTTLISASPVDSQGKLAPQDYMVMLSPRSCYKGSVGATVDLFMPAVDPGWGVPFADGAWGLFFLTELSAGTYRVTDGDGILPFMDLPVEVPAGLDGLARIESDLMRIVSGRDATARDNALNSLDRFPELSPTSIEKLHEFHWEADADLAFRKLALLAKSRVSGSLVELAKALGGRDQSRPIPAVGEIGDMLADRTARADLPTLEAISRSTNPYLRLSAMTGIRRIKDPVSVPFLVDQLDSTDRDVAYQALITLAEMNHRGGEYGPSMPVFREDRCP